MNTQGDNRKNLILVIDDEEIVARVVVLHLRTAGYRVMEFTNSIAGLSYFKEHHLDIAMVILDIVMPNMDGRELFYELKAIAGPLVYAAMGGAP